MAKSSQMDDKKTRQSKANGQTPIGADGQKNKTRNIKKQSAEPNDV